MVKETSLPHQAVEDALADLARRGALSRGQGNDLALTLELVEDGRVVQTRHVPRGALGAVRFDCAGDRPCGHGCLDPRFADL